MVNASDGRKGGAAGRVGKRVTVVGTEQADRSLEPLSAGGLRELQQAVMLHQFERRAGRGHGGKDGVDLAHEALAASSFAQR